MTYEMKMLEREREAWAKSREIALAEGMQQGISVGRAEERRTRNIEIARNLQSMNMSANDISKATGLSLEEVQAL